MTVIKYSKPILINYDCTRFRKNTNVISLRSSFLGLRDYSKFYNMCVRELLIEAHVHIYLSDFFCLPKNVPEGT